MLNEEYINQTSYVLNLSKGASLVSNHVQELDSIIRTAPDYFVINLGVVDSSNREIPLWFYRLANNNKFDLVTKLISFIYHGYIKKNRAFLVKLRGKRSWVSLNKFEILFDYLIFNLKKETNAKIIVLPINIANSRVEKQVPGTINKQISFNNVIRKVCAKYSQLYLSELELNCDVHYPDGVHYSVDGHKLVATNIFNIIQNDHPHF